MARILSVTFLICTLSLLSACKAPEAKTGGAAAAGGSTPAAKSENPPVVDDGQNNPDPPIVNVPPVVTGLQDMPSVTPLKKISLHENDSSTIFKTKISRAF